MKILQRNLNRSTFAVWEMKRNVSVVILIVATQSSGLPTSQPVSCLTRLSACMKIFNTFVNQLDDEELSIGYFSRMEQHPTLHTPACLKFSPFSVTASFRRDFGHPARSIWRRLIISYGDFWKAEFTKTNHETLTPWKQISPKKFRQWQRTY